MDIQTKICPMFWRRSLSALIDLIWIYCAGFLLHLLIMRWRFFHPFMEFAICWFLYYFLCYRFLKGSTLAKILSGLKVTSLDQKLISLKQIFIREGICKFLILLVIPSLIIHRLHFYTKGQIWSTIFIIVAASLVIIILLFVLKRPLWEIASSTRTVRIDVTNRKQRLLSIAAIATIFILTIYIKIAPSVKDFREANRRFYPEFPVNSETRKYADFIKTHSSDPVEYIFQLFNQYDLVVLDERFHPEYTQYDLFFKIIDDPRFISQIGNIYTEFGSQSFQDTLTDYLKTIFPDEDSLNKATAWLQNNSCSLWPSWGYTNVFDFLKFVNKLNNGLTDSLKINWYFTDIPMDWSRMTMEKFRNIPRMGKRDKIMADRICSIYREKIRNNEKRRKGLVIMNHRHGFGLIRDSEGRKSNNFLNTICATAILMDSLQGKVSNVLINTIPLGRFSSIFGPVRFGKWDKAFELAGNHPAAFDFTGSPFGDDNFDEFLWNSSSELKYKDVFTGFIFYKPLEQHIKKEGFPYFLYNFQDTLIRRSSCLGNSYVEMVKNDIRIRSPYLNQTISDDFPYSTYYNLIANIGLSLIIALTLLLALVFYKNG